MGLFSFIKGAGEKFFGIRDKKEERREEAAEAAAEAAAREAAEDAAAIEHITSVIGNMGLEVQDLSITIDDDVATVTGLAKDQATKEKIILIIGNNEGIAGVMDNMEVEIAAPEAVFHTVEKGDTLSKIAKTVYGDAMKYPLIFEANRPMLSDPDKIYPGQVLRIPTLEE